MPREKRRGEEEELVEEKWERRRWGKKRAGGGSREQLRKVVRVMFILYRLGSPFLGDLTQNVVPTRLSVNRYNRSCAGRHDMV